MLKRNLVFCVFFLTVFSCSQPTDPSYLGPEIQSIEGEQISFAGIPCTLRITVSDEKNYQVRIRTLVGDDTSSWSEYFPSNVGFEFELEDLDTGINSIFFQAKNSEDMTSPLSSPFYTYAAVDSEYFYDSFNSADSFLDTTVWTFGTAGEAVVKISDGYQRRAIFFHDPYMGSSWITVFGYIPLADSGEISFYAFIPTSSSQNGDNVIAFRTFPWDWEWSSRGMHFGIVADSLSYKIGTQWIKLCAIEKGQWNQIQILYNTVSKKYCMSLNGQNVSPAIDFDGDGTENVIFQILCPDNAFRDSIWFDDIKFKIL